MGQIVSYDNYTLNDIKHNFLNQSSFPEMNLANLPNLAKMFSFYKYILQTEFKIFLI